MTDFEQKIQSMLRGKGDELRSSSALSPRTLRRVRIRQGAVAVVTGTVALSIGLAAFAGARSLMAASPRVDPAAPQPATSQTSTQSPRPEPTETELPKGLEHLPPHPPPVARLEHGGTYFGVYFEVQQGFDARKKAITRAERRISALGYEPSVLDINCNPGAREGLGLHPKRDYVAVALYLRTEEQARQFVDAYGGEVVGIAGVKTLCLD